ncbi:MAG: CHAT domain-containing protein, partial [Acidobacteriota bacterium]
MKGVHRALALALGCLGLTGASCRDGDASTPGLSLLIEAVGDWRPVEGRLCGGFAHGPFQPQGNAREVAARYQGLAQAYLLLKSEHLQKPSAQASASLARYELIRGHANQAIARLERAVAESPQDACLLNDLSVAYLTRFGSHDQPLDLVRAFSTIEKATRPGGDLPEVRFNRALIHGHLFLNTSARSLWEAYLELDSLSNWASEARRMAAELETETRAEQWNRERKRLLQASSRGDQAGVLEVVSPFPQQAREYALWEILPAWADAVLAGDELEAARRLQTARRIGQALQQVNGNRLPADAVAAIDQADSRVALQRLAAAHRAFRDGRKLYDEPDIRQAQASLEQALPAFRKAGSPFVYWTEYYLALCRYQLYRYEEAWQIWQRLRTPLQESGYPMPLARFLRLTAMIESIEGRWHNTLARYRTAFELVQDQGEPGEATDLARLLAEILQHLGRSDESWRYFVRVLAGVSESSDPRPKRLSYMGAARWAEKADEDGLALTLYDEAVRWARSSGHPQDLASALSRRAAVREKLGLLDEAKQDLETGRAALAEIADPTIRRDYSAILAATESKILLRNDPPAALQRLGQIVRIYRETSFDAALPGVYYQKAQVLEALGRFDEAEADLVESIRRIEGLRESIEGDELRLSYFYSVREVYDALIGLQASRGKLEAAFASAERSRARLLLDQLDRVPGRSGRAAPPRPLQLEELRGQLPEGIRVIQYAVLSNRLIIWVIGRTGWDAAQLEIDSTKLSGRVRSLLQGLQKRAPAEELAPQLSALYEDLLLPIEAHLEVGDTLVFVPDRFLARLPFSALLNPATGRYLVEDYPQCLAPSSTVFSARLPKSHHKHTNTALLIGNPDFDRVEHPDLPALQGAAAEVEAVSRLYRQADVLTGKAATKEAFLTSAGDYSVVHLAAHTLIDPHRPFESAIVLAPSGGGSGLVQMHEVLGREFHKTAVVVLSACRTAYSGLRERGDYLFFVYPLLASGVTSVVSTWWE